MPYSAISAVLTRQHWSRFILLGNFRQSKLFLRIAFGQSAVVVFRQPPAGSSSRTFRRRRRRRPSAYRGKQRQSTPQRRCTYLPANEKQIQQAASRNTTSQTTHQKTVLSVPSLLTRFHTPLVCRIPAVLQRFFLQPKRLKRTNTEKRRADASPKAPLCRIPAVLQCFFDQLRPPKCILHFCLFFCSFLLIHFFIFQKCWKS